MKTDSNTSQKKATVGVVIWIILVLIVLVWGAYWEWVAPRINGGNQFDPLNALFSGLAFWGVIYAILLQKSELVLQREELELTRGEVRGQKEQLEAQNHTMKQQRFEYTFFSLLNLFASLVSSIEVEPGMGAAPLKGRDSFTLFYHEFQRSYVPIQRKTPDRGLSELCIDTYAVFANFRQTYVGHYFRTLYNIIKFIAASDVPNKQIYINLVRAQLSSSELNLLFYNCLSNYGNKKFKPFVEEFGLLENMELENLIDQRHKDLYKESAFKSQF